MMKRFLRGISRPGGQTIEIEMPMTQIKVNHSDFFDRHGDGDAWAPLTPELPVGTVVTVLAQMCTIAFNDSRANAVGGQVVNDIATVTLGDNITVASVSEDNDGVFEGLSPQLPFVVTEKQRLWVYFGTYALDGSNGEIAIYLRIELP